jgi:hypothetical protein
MKISRHCSDNLAKVQSTAASMPRSAENLCPSGPCPHVGPASALAYLTATLRGLDIDAVKRVLPKNRHRK